MTKPPDIDAAWHLDKRVPIALIISIFLTFGGQAIAFTIWATRLDNRVTVIESNQEARDQKVEKLGDISIDIATIKANAEAQKDKIDVVQRGIENLMQMKLDAKSR